MELTFLELFKNSSAEKIVEEFGKYIKKLNSVRVLCSSPWTAFDYDYFNGINECPENCVHMDEGDDSFAPGCYLDRNETCPYGMNLVENSKKQFIEWLNTDISKGKEV